MSTTAPERVEEPVDQEVPNAAQRGLGLVQRTVFGWSTETTGVVLGSAVVILICLGLFYLTTATDSDTWVPILMILSMIFISVPLCNWASGKPRDRRLRRILILALILKLLAAGPRYYMIEAVYKGEADAARYHQAGQRFVLNLQDGHWSIAGSELTSFPRSTRVVGYMTGMLYVVFGATYFGGFLIFSWLAWLGLLMFLRAFQVGFPNAPPYRAALLIFFLPSLLFWPSSTGKDAVMVFLIGMLTLGVSRLLTSTKPVFGIIWTAIAGVAIANIRPHLLVIATVAMLLSLLARPHGHGGPRGVLVRVLMLMILIPVLVSGIGRMDTIMGTSGGGSESINASLDETVARTEIGGSAFHTTAVRRPWDVPAALVTVLYRPFIIEARNVQMLISAMEGLILTIMTVIAARWIWQIFPLMYRNNFAAYCGGYILGFVIAFSNIGNVGILSRQRIQMYPLLMILVAGAYERHRLAKLAKELEAQQAEEATREANLVALPGTPSAL